MSKWIRDRDNTWMFDFSCVIRFCKNTFNSHGYTSRGDPLITTYPTIKFDNIELSNDSMVFDSEKSRDTAYDDMIDLMVFKKGDDNEKSVLIIDGVTKWV